MKSGTLLLFLVCGFLSFSQGIFHEKIGYESGITSERIYDILKDSKGYIWCTSDEGLIKYNGKNFTVYPAPGNFSRSGSFLQEDRYGRIWYQTFDGAILYFDDEALHAQPYFKNSGFKPYAINNDFLYHISDRGVERLNLKSMKSELLTEEKRLVFCHLIGDYLYFGNKQIHRMHLPTQKREKVYQIGSQIHSLVSFAGADELILTDKSQADPVFIRIGVDGTIREEKLALGETIQNVYLEADQFWFFTQNGIIIKDKHHLDAPPKRLLEGKNVSSLAKDKNGYRWIGSPSSGIYLIKNTESREYVLSNDKYSSISSRDGILYTGTTSGKIYEHDADLNSHLFFDTRENNQVLAMDFNSLKDWDLFTGNGSYFISHHSGRTLRIHPSIKEITRINDQEIGVAATGFTGRIQLKELLDEHFGSVGMVADLRAKSCAYDQKQDLLYVASNQGLISIDRKGNETNCLYLNSELFVKRLIYTDDRILGITFEGKLFEIKNGRIHFRKGDLFFQNIKRCGNQCYLQTSDAIYLYKNDTIRKQNSFRNANHIIDFEVIGNQLYLITSEKLIRTSLHEEERGLEIPSVQVLSVLFNNQSMNDWNRVPFDKNEIRIGIDVVNFDYLSDYDFVYSINGKEYTFNQGSSEISFPALEPGMYTIEFKITDKQSGQVIFQNRLPQMIIKPPFWKQWWFVASAALLVALILFGLYRRKMNQIDRKNRAKLRQLILENSLKESRLQLIKSQMNPHFFFNAINNIQSYIFTNETKEASAYLSKFSRLTRKILEFSDVNTITLAEEIEALTLYLELQKMRFEDLHFEINTDRISSTDQIIIPTMMFQPYVENAILHGLSHSTKPKELSIQFDRENDVLITVIRDNGVGRSKSEEINEMNPNKNKSFATKANLERIQLLNQHQYLIEVDYKDILDGNGDIGGTEVRIQIEL